MNSLQIAGCVSTQTSPVLLHRLFLITSTLIVPACSHNVRPLVALRGIVNIPVERFRDLAENIPILCWMANPDGFIIWYNRHWYDFTGTTPDEMEGWGWQSVHDPIELPRVLERWQHSIESGEPFEMVFPLRKADGTFAPFLTRVNPERDASGEITGWFGVNTDITEQVKAEQSRAVLASELSHRIKNIFSVVAGLISLSARSFPEAKSFARDVNNRISALATAHDCIKPHDDPAATARASTLFELKNYLLAPYRDADRVAVLGDDITLSEKAATSLALLIHELATNSTKYGALSVPEGKVTVESKVSDKALRIDWSEHNGPPVKPPISLGFGSSLTRISIEAQLGGRITYDWQPSGLIVRATVPKSNLADQIAS